MPDFLQAGQATFHPKANKRLFISQNSHAGQNTIFICLKKPVGRKMQRFL